MPRLPRVTARQIIAVLEQIGFSLARQSGSHMIYKECCRQARHVPFHGTVIPHPKVLKSILRDAELSVEDLKKLF